MYIFEESITTSGPENLIRSNKREFTAIPDWRYSSGISTAQQIFYTCRLPFSENLPKSAPKASSKVHKNSSISQLSGGEKALTALALVFAIFELNPAPFCILDEVDAPLDDLNTMRFINMVEEMSKTVQFIFITHNKVSMEKSDHLMGVTMQEAGVSRMVSVDVNQALEFAEV